MDITLETTTKLERRMTVALPKEQVEQAYQARLQKLSKSLNIKGFRPGKVPVKVVQQRYGEDVRQEVLDQLMRDSFIDAVDQKALHPAGMPTFTPQETADIDGFEFVATFEVLPEFEPAAMDNNQFELERKEK